ncbi:TetR/AcrR family transcriptional regulator [Streptomyces boluensis]|uniref:TetR family transcriptional regulator n=1 Tax=Streptomyces boluensis TaxID=1775135 RepID=A0A964UJ52_9ACTN|nr:TetR/AcrR family transcriptional regulator [Streptomyces boluensis]NBE50044.1 TetR family transcriptional regulator [Streptomyces boluensis]
MTSTSRARPGRPVDPDIEPRVIKATLEVYGAVGWAGFTIDAVARTSKVGKAAIYRRWASKQDLIAAAILSLKAPKPVEVTGHLRDDLTEIANRVARRYLGPHGLAHIRAMVEAKVYPDVLGEALEHIRRGAIASGRKTVLAAIEAGELPPGTSPSLVMDGLAGTIMHHILMVPNSKLAKLADDPSTFIEQAVDFVLAGAGWSGPEPE